MASTFTPNIQLNQPARGDDVGTWDTQVNGNMSLLDLVVGGITTIPLNNSNVVLSAAQFQAKQITFNSTLTGNVTVTFPTSFTKSYEIVNFCTGSSAFVITLATTAGGQVICPPPGEAIDCWNDGANLNFKNFGRIGSYWDYAGSSVPNWVSGCSPIQPFLNCNGGPIPNGYTVLPMVLGSTTLPDARGSVRMALDQSAGRISSAVAGFNPNVVGTNGGAQATTLSSLHLPKLVEPASGHTHSFNAVLGNPVSATTGGAGLAAAPPSGSTTGNSITGITYGSSSQIGAPVVQPTYVGGLTLIRAA